MKTKLMGFGVCLLIFLTSLLPASAEQIIVPSSPAEQALEKSAATAGDFAGFYIGVIYVGVKGLIGETSAGAVFLTVDSAGNVGDGSLLNGIVNAAGVITWHSPNSASLSAGSITGPILVGTGSSNTVTYRVQATNTSGAFGQGGALSSSLVWRNPKPNGDFYNKVVYRNGQFLAVGRSGAVGVSADGITWTRRTTTTGKELFSADYGNGTWVVVGEFGTVFSSTDGVNFIPRSIATFQNVRGVAFGHGRFIAVDLAGNIFSSTNGAAWTNLHVAGVDAYNGVEFANGSFYAGGYAGGLRISADGVTWSPVVSTGANSMIYGTTFGAGKYVTVSFSGISQFTSADGSGATLANPGFIPSSVAAYGNGRFVIGNTSSHAITSSADAVTWTNSQGYYFAPTSVAFGNNMFVAVGSVIQVSTNGLEWRLVSYAKGGNDLRDVIPQGTSFLTAQAPYNSIVYQPGLRVGDGGMIETNPGIGAQIQLAKMPSPTTNDLLGAAASATRAVIVGRNGTILAGAIKGGSPPTNWTIIPSGTGNDLNSVTTDPGGNFLTVGAGGVVLQSTSGTNWTAANSGVTANLNRVKYLSLGTNARFVAVGDAGTILTSVDGSVWVKRDAGVTTRLTATVSALGRILVVMGEDGTMLRSLDLGTNWIITRLNSPYKMLAMATWTAGAAGSILGVGEGFLQLNGGDGTNWSYTGGVGPNYFGVTYAGGRYITVSDNGMLTSTDGVEWTKTGLGIPSRMCITYGNGLYVSGGMDSQLVAKNIYTSPDGVNWTAQITPVNLGVHGVIYANNMFVAVGYNATVMTSVDGTNWINRTITNGTQLNSIAYGAGKFVAVGHGLSRYSSDGISWSTGDPGNQAEGVTFGANLFVAVGLNGSIRVSSNGVSWATMPSGTNSQLWSVGYVNNRFVAVGDNGLIITSADGTNWSRENSNILPTLYGVASSGSDVLVVGAGGAILQTSAAQAVAPSITSQPTSAQNIAPGDMLILNVGATGEAPLQYHWRRNNVPLADGGRISGATSATLNVSNAGTADAGTYTVVVSNSHGNVTSSNAVVTVTVPLRIGTQPHDATVPLGGNVTLKVAATGGGILKYQWQRNGNSLTGKNAATLLLAKVNIANAGTYRVVVSNGVDSLTSDPAIVGVTPPAPVITAPRAGVLTSNSGNILIAGTVAANSGVTNVFWQINGGAPQAATGTTSWSALAPMAPGTNVFVVVAQNPFGNSPAVSNRYVFVPAGQLTVLLNGSGKFSPVFGTRSLIVDKNYTITALPGAGQMFSNWMGGTSEPYAELGTAPALTFAMKSNLVLQANFVPNPFLTRGGVYNGLFGPTNSARAQGNSGAANLMIALSGTFTGKLLMGTESIPLTGKFNVGGSATVVAKRPGKNSVTNVLQLDFANQSVSGITQDGNFSAVLAGDRAVFSTTHKATNFAGVYTLTIPGVADPMVGPFGTSYGTVTVDVAGNVKLTGSLADGAPLSQSSTVSKDGLWPFYAGLYGGRGSIWVWAAITNQTLNSISDLSWINSTNSSVTAVYRSGFTNQMSALVASAYAATNRPLLALTNGPVTLTGGTLANAITNHIVLGNNNLITVPDLTERTNKLVLTINKTTGQITGSFANPANPKLMIKVGGVLLQNQMQAAGYFLGTSNSGVFLWGP